MFCSTTLQILAIILLASAGMQTKRFKSDLPFTTDDLKEILCLHNPPGNYPNPFDCSTFIVCEQDNNFHFERCKTLSNYNPFLDRCEKQSANYDCPTWTKAWNNGTFSCGEHVAQRTLPENPKELCGNGIIRCQPTEEFSNQECPSGTAYSLAVMGCISVDICMDLDMIIFLSDALMEDIM